MSTNELLRARAALARRDCLTAAQLALRTAVQSTNPPELRCDAYGLLALAALQLESPESALAYAVGANLMAQRVQDGAVAREAEAVLGFVLARYPDLSSTTHEDHKL